MYLFSILEDFTELLGCSNNVKIHCFCSLVHQYLINFSLSLSIPFCYLLPSFSFLSIYGFSLSLFLFFLYLFTLIYSPCSSPVSHHHHSNWWLSFVSYPLSSLSTKNPHNRVVHFPLWCSSIFYYHAHQDSELCQKCEWLGLLGGLLILVDRFCRFIDFGSGIFA